MNKQELEDRLIDFAAAVITVANKFEKIMQVIISRDK
jgi:hypothetical protein